MATARRATKLTMMATTTPMATGDNDNDDGDGATGDGATGDGATGDGAMGYDDDDNGDGIR
jgi:hypothetical protein